MTLSGGRDGMEVDALRTDRYLESLLAAQGRHAFDAPADPELDPAIRDAARRLAHDLVRVHPSFRFEERLASRLADVAAALRLPAVAGDDRRVRPLITSATAGSGGLDPAAAIDPVDIDPLADPADLVQAAAARLAAFGALPGAIPGQIPRPLLIGGAITSALSLAGAAAWVAWRWGKPPASPMVRAARAVRQAKVGLRQPGPRRRFD